MCGRRFTPGLSAVKARAVVIPLLFPSHKELRFQDRSRFVCNHSVKSVWHPHEQHESGRDLTSTSPTMRRYRCSELRCVRADTKVRVSNTFLSAPLTTARKKGRRELSHAEQNSFHDNITPNLSKSFIVSQLRLALRIIFTHTVCKATSPSLTSATSERRAASQQTTTSKQTTTHRKRKRILNHTLKHRKLTKKEKEVRSASLPSKNSAKHPDLCREA